VENYLPKVAESSIVADRSHNGVTFIQGQNGEDARIVPHVHGYVSRDRAK